MPLLSSLDRELHDASRKGDSTRVETLLQEDGAEVNVEGFLGFTPLHWASINDHKKVVSILLGNGACVDAVNECGRTPLHNASFHGHKEVVSILLSNSADVDAADEDGNTPLHDACQSGCKEVVAIFLQHGADVNAMSNCGSTAMDKAKQRRNSDIIVTMLKKHQFQQNIAATLRSQPAVPVALWSCILGRVSSHPELVYNVLAEKPDLFMGDEPNGQHEEERTQVQPTMNSSEAGFQYERDAKHRKLHRH